MKHHQHFSEEEDATKIEQTLESTAIYEEARPLTIDMIEQLNESGLTKYQETSKMSDSHFNNWFSKVDEDGSGPVDMVEIVGFLKEITEKKEEEAGQADSEPASLTASCTSSKR